MKYPNDENGDALRRMELAGDDLTRPRDIDFTVVFASQDAADKFANRMREEGYPASVEFTGTDQGFPWDVVVVKHMIPSYERIGAVENSLQELASSFGGHNDGWGCLSEAPCNVPADDV